MFTPVVRNILRMGRTWIANVGRVRNALAGRYPRAYPIGRSLVLVLLAVSIVAASFWAGIVAQELRLPERAHHFLERALLSTRSEVLGNDEQTLPWTQVITNLHTLEFVEIRIGPPMGGGGALTEVGGHLVFVSPLGRFSYLSNNNRLGPIALTAPMGVEALRKSRYNTDTLFSWHHFRAYDLLAVRTSSDRYDLYASFSRFVRDDCFQYAVYRARLEATSTEVRAVSSDWEEMFTARPGCIRPKDRGWRFLGLGAGGRIVQLNEHTLLIGVGDHQYDGFNDSWASAQDPKTDLGKIVALDPDTKTARVFATGVRNPQGLVVMRDGRVFDTEHGPQGGDEINLIRDGGNYGWPLATYGVNYGYPRRDWPFTKTPAEHEGFDKPVFAFTPAIGPSNIVEANAQEFPLWKSDAVMGSLRGSTLFHLRIEGDRVRYVEPIYSKEGVRFRDVVSLSDGRIATLTNNGTVMIFRNAELHATEPRTVTVSGFGTLTPAYPEEVPPAHLTPAERGKQLFEASCSYCHSPSTELGPGPPLGGIVGRRVGAVSGFGYSPALAKYDGVWTEDLLLSFLTEPDRHFHGTVMPPPTMDWLEYPSVVAYLATLKDTVPTGK
jgi:cytochrome c2